MKCRKRFVSAAGFCALMSACTSLATRAAGAPAPIRQSRYVSVAGAELFLMTRGRDRSAMTREILGLDLARSVPSVDVPVFFSSGM